MSERLEFDPKDPYPFFADGEPPYSDAQAHSREVDAWLGFTVEALEEDLTRKKAEFQKPGQQLWIGLPAHALLTPYTEFRALVEKLRPAPNTTIVDLGAGYGRLAFVLARHAPEVNFVGYELVRTRVDEGNRIFEKHALTRAKLLAEDLADPTFSPVAAEFYFLYDYGSRTAIEKTLQDLRKIAQSRPITVVGRGRASRDAIERDHPWLSQIVPPEHFAHTSIYRTHAASPK